MSLENIQLISTFFLLFLSAIVGGIFAKWLKLPILLGYILVGFIVSNLFPSALNRQILDQAATVGVTLLLFTIGVEFSFHRLKKYLSHIAWAATLQIVSCTLLFFVFLSLVGIAGPAALLIAVAASLSSTAIAVRIFSEAGEMETMPGMASFAWLIVQDVSVIPIMVILPLVVAAGNTGLPFVLSGLVSSVFVLALLVLFGSFALGRILSYVAKIGSREIFLLCVVGVVFAAAILTYSIGLSAALGAFIAGLLIAETSQNHAIFAEIRPLRDLFGVVFFVSLGMVLSAAHVVGILPLLLGLSLVIIVMKWVVVYILARVRGFHKKNAFIIALALAQMSEFGFILAKEGRLLGILTEDLYTLLVALTFVTIFFSTPLFTNAHRVYYWLHRQLGKAWPDVFPVYEMPDEKKQLQLTDHVVICGFGRVGKYIGRALDMAQIPYVVVDYNQAAVARLREKDIQVVYGDPADRSVLDYAQVDLARALVVAIPDRHTQELIITNARSLSKKLRIICRTHHEEDQAYLKALGVGTIVQPEFTASLAIAERLLTEYGISDSDIRGNMSRLKIEHGMG